MWLKHLRLENFCNYECADLEFSPGINIVAGENAHGKSNLIDAIYYLCFLRGLRGLPDDGVVRFGMGGFVLRGAFVFTSGLTRECRIVYDREQGKVCTVDRKRVDRRAELVGWFPVVAMSGEDYRLTRGGPAERRRFLDVLLCQVSTSYLEDLRSYTATLQQRNALLKAALRNGEDYQWESWTEQLVKFGCRLMAARAALVSEITNLVADYFARVTGGNRSLALEYLPSVRARAGGSLEQSFLDDLRRLAAREKVFGATLVGPHRDDLAFKIGGRDLRQYGSRGDHKAALIALRLSEHAYIQGVKSESPLLLMDDLLVDLDEKRAARLAALFPPGAQVVATSTKRDAWKSMGLQSGGFRHFWVEGGAVKEVQ